jgi:hypothetical protein
MTEPSFTVEVFQNEYLPAGGREVNAIVTVTAPDSGQAPGLGTAADGGRAEIVIVDCSGSMDYPHSKIVQARAATAAAIDVIADGVAFAVIAGTDVARPVFPPRWQARDRWPCDQGAGQGHGVWPAAIGRDGDGHLAATGRCSHRVPRPCGMRSC